MGGETNSKVVQAFQTFSKRYNTAQTFSNLFKPVRNVTKLLKPSQTFSNFLKPLQTSSSLINNFSKDAQNFSNLLKLSQNFSQKQNKNKKKTSEALPPRSPSRLGVAQAKGPGSLGAWAMASPLLVHLVHGWSSTDDKEKRLWHTLPCARNLSKNLGAQGPMGTRWDLPGTLGRSLAGQPAP